MEREKLAEISLVFMVTIVNRGYGEKIKDFFTHEGVTVNLMALGKGTASSEILDCLGLGEIGKDVLISTMPLLRSQKILQKLHNEWNIKKPGRGISFTIPITSVCGMASVRHLKGLPLTEEGECMKQNIEHDLIIAVTNRGFSDMVMDAARDAGVTGGTIIHARGTGLKEAEKFLGITIQPEKELVLMVVEEEKRSDIMKAIGKNAGIKTEARAVVFSLPVNAVEGLETNIFKQK